MTKIKKKKEIIAHDLPVAEWNGSHPFDWVHPVIEWVLPIRGPAKPRQLVAALLISLASSPSSVIRDTPSLASSFHLVFLPLLILVLGREKIDNQIERDRERMENLLGLLKVKVLRGVNLAYRDATGSDPYVVIRMGHQVISHLLSSFSSQRSLYSGFLLASSESWLVFAWHYRDSSNVFNYLLLLNEFNGSDFQICISYYFQTQIFFFSSTFEADWDYFPTTAFAMILLWFV